MFKRGKRKDAIEATGVWDPTEVEHSDQEGPSALAADRFTRSQRALRWARIMVWTAVFATPLLILANLLAVGEILFASKPEPVAQASTDSPNKAAAQTAVEQWLSADDAPIPGGRVLSWDRSDVIRAPGDVEQPNGKPKFMPGLERHELSVVDSSGATYTAEVQVAYSDVQGAQVLGTPALIPQIPGDESGLAQTDPWGMVTTVSAGESATSAAKAWADTYFSGDPSRLKLLIGDGDQNRGYMPMPKGRVVAASVERAALLPGTEDTEENKKNPPALMVRLKVQVDYSGGSDTQAPSFTYDLLMRGTDTAAPRVTAWGGPGSAPSLEDYENGVAGRLIKVDQVPEISASPSPSKSSSSSSSPSPSPSDSDEPSPSDSPSPSSSPASASSRCPSPRGSAASTPARRCSSRASSAGPSGRPSPSTATRRPPSGSPAPSSTASRGASSCPSPARCR